MKKKLGDNSILWFIPLLIAFGVIFYFFSAHGRYLLLQLIALIFCVAAFYLFLNIIWAKLQSKYLKTEQILKNTDVIIVRNWHIYIAVIVSIMLFFFFMDSLAKILFITFVLLDAIITISGQLFKYYKEKSQKIP